MGESVPMIGRMLGHREIEITARYAHLAPNSVRDAAGRVAQTIAEHIPYLYPRGAVTGP